jgi:hypothetical protein
MLLNKPMMHLKSAFFNQQNIDMINSINISYSWLRSEFLVKKKKKKKKIYMDIHFHYK